MLNGCFWGQSKLSAGLWKEVLVALEEFKYLKLIFCVEKFEYFFEFSWAWRYMNIWLVVFKIVLGVEIKVKVDAMMMEMMEIIIVKSLLMGV